MTNYIFAYKLHLYNTINKLLRQNNLIVDELTEIQIKDGSYITYKEYINFLIEVIWKYENDEKTKEQIIVFQLHRPSSIATWRAKTHEYENIIDYVYELKEILRDYEFIFSVFDELDEYKKFNIYDIDEDLARCIFKYPYEKEKDLYNVNFNSELSDEFVNELINLKNKPGVYFIYGKNKELIYVGKSTNLERRILSSLRERKGSYIEYALVSAKSDLSIYESYYISLLKPPLNTEGKYNDETTITLEDIRNYKKINVFEKEFENE